IDVVLVLLIIFMILSPFLAQSQIPVNLPKAVSSRSVDQDDPIRVQINRQGDFFVGGKRILRNQLEQKLREPLARQPGRAVLIEADRDVSFKNVVFALDTAEQLEAAKVGVAVLTSNP
ncbi:MAG TPA: biopolymer transporter ExbD, partial [Elusimicrobiota bacterium]|nr:biopolymer transporter ExbD [Elusimicrobiota bacterium]